MPHPDALFSLTPPLPRAGAGPGAKASRRIRPYVLSTLKTLPRWGRLGGGRSTARGTLPQGNPATRDGRGPLARLPGSVSAHDEANGVAHIVIHVVVLRTADGHHVEATLRSRWHGVGPGNDPIRIGAQFAVKALD